MSGHHPDMLPALGEAYRRNALTEAERRRQVSLVRRSFRARRLFAGRDRARGSAKVPQAAPPTS